MIFVIGLFPRIHTSPFSQRYRPTDLDVMTVLDVVTICIASCAYRDGNKTARKCWGIRRWRAEKVRTYPSRRNIG
jgi:hypothetical protein